MTSALPKKRGRPPKARPASHTVVVAVDGRLRFVTRPGPKPPHRPGRPKGPSKKSQVAAYLRALQWRPPSACEMVRDETLRVAAEQRAQARKIDQLILRRLGTIELDESLCVAVAEQLQAGRSTKAAIDRVAHARAVSFETARAAYYAHRDRLEWSDD